MAIKATQGSNARSDGLIVCEHRLKTLRVREGERERERERERETEREPRVGLY